jgi:GNAT superfamily N-acetyltransferase/RimJ/RimL family protein N-acetyltransferase
VRIEQFDPRSDEERLEACYRIAQATVPVDDPNTAPFSLRRFRGWAYGWADEPQQVWLATDDAGEPVGYYMLTLPERENRKNAFCDPIVAVSRRREGIGTALLVHIAEQAEQNGRSLMMGDARVGAPGAAFAEACGARPGIHEVRRVLDLDSDLRSKLPGLRAGAVAHAAGYSLRFWSGPTPDELVDQVCALNDAMQDAPHDAAFEPLVWTAERLKANERKGIELGFRWHSVAAIADDSGEMAALTDVQVDPDTPEWGHQGLTAVTRPHRGHRLGLLSKVAMLGWLAEIEPQIQRVVTYNAAENEHMIAVNEQLGHRVSDVFQGWEIDVAAALKLAS